MEEVLTYIALSTISIVIGFIIDLIVGDPHFLLHPVVIIGKIIAGLEKITRKIFPKNKVGERIAGGVTAILTVFLSTIVPFAILFFAYKFNVYVFLFISSIFSWQILATKSLKTESQKVYNEIKSGNLGKARFALSMIVGRDTENLNECEIVKATVETVAENTSDGVIAPLIFLILGGATLGFCYKAVNTLDSMVGYRNKKYQYFGTFAAKLDDFANYLPSRITALMMIFACNFGKFDKKSALKIWKRDRRNHDSPNSAQTESVVAGALNVQLAGNAVYGGVVKVKKTIGDDNRQIENEDIKRTNKLMYLTAILSLVIFAIIKIAIIFILNFNI